ncbi:MAG: AglZ/HisF2 family acetamidino modification protein [Cryomorphaceae bacterium]|jgi:cyclase|nr:AglZ/HisF2 family acetamidino modification protein [Cryomorphaceae bacterium]
MHRPRLIPVLLLKNQGLVKTIGFRSPKYIGDPMHAVHIFNELKADELVFLDIEASKEGRTIDPEFVRKIGEEANMPFAVGGGIRSLDTIRELLRCGAEKVVLNSVAIDEPDFVRRAANEFGSSTIVVCLDVKKKWLTGLRTWAHGGMVSSGMDPITHAVLMQEYGAGELIVQSIDKDGAMTGYDVELIRGISERVSIPVVALGGAGSIDHMRIAYEQGFADGLAAGSFFVYQSKRRGVLINYPGKISFNR